MNSDEADGHWRAEQYEGEAYTGRKVVLKGALVGFTSPDRFNWTKIEERWHFLERYSYSTDLGDSRMRWAAPALASPYRADSGGSNLGR